MRPRGKLLSSATAVNTCRSTSRRMYFEIGGNLPPVRRLPNPEQVHLFSQLLHNAIDR